MRNRLCGICFFVSALFLAGPLSAKVLSVMSYNVENLFDTAHDPGKQDWTYLPLAKKKKSREAQDYCKSLYWNPYYQKECRELDWTPDKLKKKLLNIARVVKSVNRGRGPDVLILQEVENKNVLELLNKYGFKGKAYKEIVLVEGADRRGIDTAIMSKYPLLGRPVLHDVNDKDLESGEALFEGPFYGEELFSSTIQVQNLRGILEATFNVEGSELTFLANHWPSQGKKSPVRYAVAQAHNNVVDKLVDQGKVVISAGDFNTLPKDDPHGLKEWVTNGRRSHAFYDSWAEKLKEGFGDDAYPGTHWYRGHYSKFDRIFLMRDSVGHDYDVQWNDFEVHAPDWLMTEADQGPHDRKPHRFDFKTATGYSDHLPLHMKIRL